MSSGRRKLSGGLSALRVRRRGFSLVEMLIASFIAIIIFTVGFVIITGTIQAKNESSARIRATENARLFFQMLERDLAAAYPMKFGVAPNPVTGIYTKEEMFEEYDITVGQNVSTGTAIKIDNNNSLQFYTRIDGRGVTDEYAFVRYYINNAQQLCREVIHSNDLDTEPAWLPIAQMLDKCDFAMFDRVRSMYVSFHKWDDIDKDYFPKLSSRDTLPKKMPVTNNLIPISAATHIRVQLYLFDTLGTIQVNEGGQTVIVDQDVEKSADNLTIRVMQKLLPIPSGFTN
jgi:type II secretory pathway pseudopilin PulG